MLLHFATCNGVLSYFCLCCSSKEGGLGLNLPCFGGEGLVTLSISGTRNRKALSGIGECLLSSTILFVFSKCFHDFIKLNQ